MEQLQWKRPPRLNVSLSGRVQAINHWTLRPAERTSLQKHFIHDEIWFVVSGVAEFTIENKVVVARSGDYIHIPIGTVHRVTNSAGGAKLICFELSTEESKIDEVVENYYKFGDKGVVEEHPGRDVVPLDDLDDAAFLEYVRQRGHGSPAVAAGLMELASQFATAADPVPTSLAAEGITPAQMAGWRAVNAVRSREHRANLTPEQAAHQSREGTKRSAASRERMSPEQQAARSAREAERLRQKRALAKDPQP